MRKISIILILALLANFIFAQDKDKLNKNLLTEARKGNLSEVKDLLSKGADINAKGIVGWTPLMNATIADNGKEVFDFLIENGADLKAVNNNGGTFLHTAALKGSIYAIETALNAGIDINFQNTEGSTALILAAIANKKEFVEALLNNNADINIQNKKGNTALILAASNSKAESIVEILINAGADVNIINAKGESALKVAKNDKIKQLLIQAGAK